MAKHTITITFESDAPQDVVEELAYVMECQLEFLNDGDLYRDKSGKLFPFAPEGDCEQVCHDYSNVLTSVLTE